MTARRLALEVLTQVEEEAAYANLLLDAKLHRARLSRRERALATELTYGVLRWQGRLDYLLAAVADRPWDQVEPALRRLLRLGAYQLLFLTRSRTTPRLTRRSRSPRPPAGRATDMPRRS